MEILSEQKLWQLYRSPRMPRFGKRALLHEINRRSAQAGLRHARRRDDSENESTTFPNGWHANFTDLWLVEVFTPLDFPALARDLEDLNKQTRGFSAFNDYAEWISKARQQNGIAWTAIPTFASPDCRRLLPDKITEELPQGVEVVTGSISTVSSGISVLVMNFEYRDDFSSQLNELVNRRYSAQLGRRRGGAYEMLGIDQQKSEAIAKWREERAQEASAWVKTHFSGFFAREASLSLPVIELFQTTGFIPWDETTPRGVESRSLRTLGLSYDFGSYWKSEDFPSLRARHKDGWFKKGTASPDVLVLAANERDLVGGSSLPPGDTLHHVRWLVSQLAIRWALSCLVVRSGRRFNRVRDDVTQAVEKASFGDFIELRDELLQTGVDSNLTVMEAIKFADSRNWDWELPTFAHFVPPGLNANPVDLDELWKSEQLAEARRITEAEQHLREVASTAAELTNAAYNIRLQGRVFFLTIASLLVSLVALWVSYVSLKQGG
ncbi:hypothetical protein AB0I00_27895 [Streptomyces sp. NPDC050803]|uniref:hypothetical protein n=1 Tax=unclassified Streptomyces TaxID=2593676 RepID=UPI00341B0B45